MWPVAQDCPPFFFFFFSFGASRLACCEKKGCKDDFDSGYENDANVGTSSTSLENRQGRVRTAEKERMEGKGVYASIVSLIAEDGIILALHGLEQDPGFFLLL